MGYLEIPSQVTASIIQAQNNTTQVNSLVHSSAQLYVIQNLVLPPFLLIDYSLYDQKLHVQTVNIILHCLLIASHLSVKIRLQTSSLS